MSIQKTRNDIIEQALTDAGIIADGENPTDSQTKDAAIKLDYMVKDIQKTGVHLWSEELATLFLSKGQESYVLGDTANATESYTATTLSADAAASDTTISLTSTTDALAADFIGVVLDDGTLFWTTIVIPATTTITDGLSGVASSGNAVYYYTTKIGKPLRIPEARRSTNNIDLRMFKLGRQDYLQLPNKSSRGTPTNYYYKPNKDSGIFYIWPTADSVSQFINFSYYKPLSVFSTSGSDADFPNEWLRALVTNLAVWLAQSDGLVIDPNYIMDAKQSMRDALDWDQDDGDIIFEYGR